MHMELKDLPPAMRTQVLKIIAEERIRRKGASDDKNTGTVKTEDFDSRGEYEYFLEKLSPGLADGSIKAVSKHPEFVLFEAGEYQGIKLLPVRYTADFRVDYSDGTVEIVEIKSRFVKKMQRDYHIRRRIFIEEYARPNGWLFREVITDARRKSKWADGK